MFSSPSPREESPESNNMGILRGSVVSDLRCCRGCIIPDEDFFIDLLVFKPAAS